MGEDSNMELEKYWLQLEPETFQHRHGKRLTLVPRHPQ